MLIEHLLCAGQCLALGIKKEYWAQISYIASYLQRELFWRAETVLWNFVFLFKETRSFDQASISQLGF